MDDKVSKQPGPVRGLGIEMTEFADFATIHVHGTKVVFVSCGRAYISKVSRLAAAIEVHLQKEGDAPLYISPNVDLVFI